MMRTYGRGYGRARGVRPAWASVLSLGQQRRSGIIAATCPAVRVRIIGSNPIPKVGFAGANRTEAHGAPSSRGRERRDGGPFLQRQATERWSDVAVEQHAPIGEHLLQR